MTTNARFEAINQSQSRKIPLLDTSTTTEISKYYQDNVFTVANLDDNDDNSKKIKQAMLGEISMDEDLADKIAQKIKEWAIGKGATHYTHWFQPLTGSTAEKHDTFFEPNHGKTGGMEKLSGSTLTQQEPDGSSFPNGGMRNTFEARGYTVWDPSSPVFIMDTSSFGKTVYIPTVFTTYQGESLDYKGPLLKSQALLEKTTAETLNLLDQDGKENEAKKVNATLGIEQEFFLVDEALFNARPDLVATGRTLLGANAAKGQQMDDHYFGTTPQRAVAFMAEVAHEAHKVGIPLATRHNEVAPGQFEFAPTFEGMNIAIDHNMLLMDLMERVASRHKLKALFHEKPFAGVNGSGKHNNWSLSAEGKNLLSPGANEEERFQFLMFFTNIIKAVHDNEELLRASVAVAGNDHRLGANEAPPAIMSVFIGEYLTKVMTQLESGEIVDPKGDGKSSLSLGGDLPEGKKDNTDRNRTSPFAFTGNKFEFRAVGSSQNCSEPMIILNTIVANQLKKFNEDVKKAKGENVKDNITKILSQYAKDSKKILFEGNGYGDDWKNEAKKRGLSNNENTATALEAYVSKDTLDLFENTGVMSDKELKAYHHVRVEQYCMKKEIEAKVMIEMIQTQIIPAAIEYYTRVSSLLPKNENGKLNYMETLSKNLKKEINDLGVATNDLEAQLKIDENKSDEDKSISYSKELTEKQEKVRRFADTLETIMDDTLYPFPKYREMLKSL